MDAKKLHILVVEDNTIAAMMTKHVLENLGCEVTCVDDGSKAVEYAKKIITMGSPWTLDYLS